MPYRETNARMTGRITAKSFGAWITGAALLCTLAGAQSSLAAQQIAQPNAIRQSLANAGQQPPASTPAAKAQPAPKAQTQQRPTNKPPAAVKPSAAVSAKGNAKPVAKPGATPVATPVALHETVSKRDPFSPLVGGPLASGGIPDHLPPGKAGLVISMLRVDGIVKGPAGMIAVVTNGQTRTYFLREGDQLYDGSVQHITMTDVAFHQTGKDPFGKPVERQVSKPLNATPGEQQ
jgi:hypothetical protein